MCKQKCSRKNMCGQTNLVWLLNHTYSSMHRYYYSNNRIGNVGGEWVMNIDKVFTDIFPHTKRKIKQRRQNCQEAYEAI